MVRSSMFFCLVALSSLVAACGSEEKSKDEQAEEFYDKNLHVDDQKACNATGFMYDPLDAKCMTVKLSTWACTRDGLTARLTEKTTLEAEASGLAALDAQIADGYEFHQCGEDETSTAIYLVIIKKGKTDDQATLEIRHAAFAAAVPEEEAP